MILLKRKQPEEEHHVKLVAYTIILFISSLFVPFIIVASYQSMVYWSRSQWFFTTPSSAYFTFMGGMVFVACVFTFYIIFRERWDGRGLKWITCILILASLPAFIFSVQNYFYLDDNGIHYRSLLSFHETEYKWNEITEVHIVYRNHSGTTGLYQYKFEARDGRKVTIPNNNKIDENKRRIEEKIGEFHILVKDNFKNPITD